MTTKHNMTYRTRKDQWLLLIITTIICECDTISDVHDSYKEEANNSAGRPAWSMPNCPILCEQINNQTNILLILCIFRFLENPTTQSNDIRIRLNCVYSNYSSPLEKKYPCRDPYFSTVWAMPHKVE